MQDLIFIAILAAFFAIAVVFVKACEVIVGPDVEAQRADAVPASGGEQEVAA